MPPPWKQMNDFIELSVKLTPKGAKNAILAVMKEAEGGSVLKVSVTAVPENNKANTALISLLSKKLGIAKSCVQIKSGFTSTRKILKIHAIDLETLVEKLAVK